MIDVTTAVETAVRDKAEGICEVKVIVFSVDEWEEKCRA